MAKRIAAIILIYCFTALAWMSLGKSMLSRTYSQDQKLKTEVGQLWGAEQRQSAPLVYYETTKEIATRSADPAGTATPKFEIVKNTVPLDAGDVTVDLKLDYRKKGLLWYSTYRIKFFGKYRISNPASDPRNFFVAFKFPAQAAVYDNFRMLIDGKEVQSAANPPSNNPVRALTVSGFIIPESVIPDIENDVWYVSNVGAGGELASGEIRSDNNGFISRVSRSSGKMIDLKWIAGGGNGVQLDSPHGLGFMPARCTPLTLLAFAGSTLRRESSLIRSRFLEALS